MTNRTKSNTKTYSELQKLKTYEDRFKYLSLKGQVGSDTFGFDRYINQQFYKSPEWKRLRHEIIARDNACDLGIDGKDIHGKILIHHMNPIDSKDIENVSEYLLNPEYLITVTMDTHNALHYGNEGYLKKNKIVHRTSNDTSPWRK